MMDEDTPALFELRQAVPPATYGLGEVEELDLGSTHAPGHSDDHSEGEPPQREELALWEEATPRARRATRVWADLTHERSLFDRGARLVAGVDEVGRGALAGPVAVGVCVVDPTTQLPPVGLTDSKELSHEARALLVPMIQGWAVASAVGLATPEEIDECGIVGALRLAGQRALGEIMQRLGPVDTVLLDGSHNWLSEPVQDLFDAVTSDQQTIDGYEEPRVVTRVKADLACASVAGASILAKEHRDAIMRELDRDFPHYGWVTNKGYASSGHTYALTTRGPTPHHRMSWRLPGVDADAAVNGEA